MCRETLKLTTTVGNLASCALFIKYKVAYPLKAGIIYSEETSVLRLRHRKCWSSRLGQYRIWDSKIRVWSWVPRDSGPRMGALARASSNFKRHTRPLAREGAPCKEMTNCLTAPKVWSWALDWTWKQDSLVNWPLVGTQFWCSLEVSRDLCICTKQLGDRHDGGCRPRPWWRRGRRKSPYFKPLRSKADLVVR
jgi:hypothetical protein